MATNHQKVSLKSASLLDISKADPIRTTMAYMRQTSLANNPSRTNNESPVSKATKYRFASKMSLLIVVLTTQILLINSVLCDQQEKLSLSQTTKPSISLIVPQSFKLAVSQLSDENNHRPIKQQYVAVINNVQSERQNNLLRQQHKLLSLQIRDARQLKTGQLFYEHVFDYFNHDPQTHHLLLPVNLENVSFSTEEHIPNSSSPRSARQKKTTLKQVIVSVRTIPDRRSSVNGSEIVSSAPIQIDTVHSHDARHSFGFVQTDKPIYKPTDKVRIRAMIINEEFRPVVHEFKLQVKNHQNIVVEEIRFPDYNQTTQKPAIHEPVFFDHVFEFPPEPMLGQWTVNLIHGDAVANDTVSFQVKEYILPTFGVQFQSCKYILPWTKNVSGHLIAKYHYGEPVHGTLSLKYGLKESLQSTPKYVGRSDFKTIDPETGRVNFTLGLDRYKEHMWFPQVSGSYFVVEATVTNETSGHMEVIQDTSCRFVSLPYKILFDKSIEYFKPGVSQQLTVSVVEYNTDLPPPAGTRLVAEYRDKNERLLSSPINQTPSTMVRSSTILSIVETSKQFSTAAVTDVAGKATFKIGPITEDVSEIKVKIKFLNPHPEISFRNEHSQAELASAEYTLKRHESKHGWLSIMNKSQTKLNVNEIFSSELLVDNAHLRPSRTYFIIIARGEIVELSPLSSEGLVRFKATESMVPSIRLVVFGLRQDSLEMLSDSMRIDIGPMLACGLKLNVDSRARAIGKSGEKTFRPNEQVTLAIAARPGDQISLVGVDSAVYTLKSQNILESSRVIERVRLLDPGCGFGDGQNSIDVFLNAGLMIFNSNTDASSPVPIVGSSCSSIANQQKHLLDMKYGYSRPSLSAPSKSWGREIGNLLSRLTTFGRSERMKRALNSEILLENYSDPKEKACCLLGTYEDVPKSRGCDIRADIVQKHMEPIGFANCSEIYLSCCKSINENLLTSAVVTGRSAIVQEAHIVAERAHELFSAKDLTNLGSLAEIEDQTFVRTDFRETWLFDVVGVDPVDGKTSIDVKLPHSITSWTISALALNPNKPICLMPQPVKLTTFQEIILQLSMPYKVIESEQIDLVATVFNYSPEQQEVFVYMYGVQDICSEAEPGERSDRVREIIPPNSFSSVIFPIIPMKIGKFKIKVLAITKSIDLSDIVEKELNVVSKGRPVIEETTFKLDPMNQQRRNKRSIQAGNLLDDIDESKGLQRSKIRLAPQQQQNFDNIVPKTQECIVSAIGHRLGQSLQTTLLDVENLIRLPHGCGEQVMIYFGPTLYTLRYLSSLNRLTGDSRWRAIRYMQSGYKRVLNFRKDSGAFSAFAGREPSKWLTAFVAKLLCQAEHTSGIANELRIDKNVILSALDWLIDNQDNTTGSWIEENPVYHREMLGGVLKENALTSFITIALEECSLVNFRSHNEFHTETESIDPSMFIGTTLSTVDRLHLATRKAEASLIRDRRRALQKKNPYVLAMTAYALSFSKPTEAIAALEDLMTLSEKLVARNQIYWRGQYAIETSAYALQTIVQLAPYLADHLSQDGGSSGNGGRWSAPEVALAISNWLTSQRSYTGAFESTQDTVVALDALSKYAQSQSEGSLISQQNAEQSPKMTCHVKLSNITRRSIEFSETNALVLQSFKLDQFQPISLGKEELEIVTSGSGVGTMSVKLKYNVLNEEDELCHFSVEPTITEWKPQIQATDVTFDNEIFRRAAVTVIEELDLSTVEGLSGSSQPMKRPVPSLRLRRDSTAHMIDLSERNSSNSQQTNSWASWIKSKFKERFSKTNTNQTVQPTLTIASTTMITPRFASRPHHVTNRPDAKQEEWPNLMDSSNRQQTSITERRNSTSRRSVVKEARSSDTVQPSSEINALSANLSTLTNQPNSVTGVAGGPATKLYLLLEVCVRYIYSRREPDMSVIEVKILTGFKPNKADLDEVLNAPGTPAYKYEISNDKSLVTFYLRTIPSSGPYCLQFRLISESTVRNLQSGYVRVYEYYTPTHSCSNYYTPNRQSELLRVNCDSGKVCQCASRSKCPATKKLSDLGEIQTINATSARNQLSALACSDRFDFVTIVKLVSIRELKDQQRFKIYVKIKRDIKGNLTSIIEAQRRQSLLPNARQQQYFSTDITSISSDNDNRSDEDDVKAPTDQLILSIDTGCLKNDSLLIHLSYPNLRKQVGGEQMILFGKYSKLDRGYYKVNQKSTIGIRGTPVPAAVASRLSSEGISDSSLNNDLKQLEFDDSNFLQYSTIMYLDRDSILHDMTHQELDPLRKAMNNLASWLELISRRKDEWSCQKV